MSRNSRILTVAERRSTSTSSELYSPPSPLKSTIESPGCRRRTRMCRVTSSGSCMMSSGLRAVSTKKRGIRKILIGSRKVASERPAVAVQVFDLRKTVTPELILWLAQRFRAGRQRPRINRVEIVHINIKRLRCNRARAFGFFRSRAERAFRRKHHDQLALVDHFDMHDDTVVLDAVAHLKAKGRFEERNCGTCVANREIRGQPGHTAWAG